MYQFALTLALICQIPCFAFSDLLRDLANLYSRPLTILYISENPDWINVQDDDLVVYWTQNKQLQKKCQEHQAQNCVILTTKPTRFKLSLLAECASFDIAIIDMNLSTQSLTNECHIAEHTYKINPDEPEFLDHIIDDIYYIQSSRVNLHQRCHLNESPTKHYLLESTFEKKLIRQETTDPGKIWLPGLTFYDYLLYKGVYPHLSEFTDQMYENYDPLIHNDYRERNLILQGLTVKAIDYNPQKIKLGKETEKFFMKNLKKRIRTIKFYSEII